MNSKMTKYALYPLKYEHFSVKYLRKSCFSIIFNQIHMIQQRKHPNFTMSLKASLSAANYGQQIVIQADNRCSEAKRKAQKQLGAAPISRISDPLQKQPAILKKKSLECWELHEIQKLFTLYNEYGSQWALMQAQLENKSANSIKNRFYTVVRAFLRQLFISHPDIQNKKLHQIPSKIILKFYQGRKEFSRYKGLGKNLLKAVNYDTQSQELITLGKNKYGQIKAIYQLIYSEKPGNPPKASQNLPNTQSVQNFRPSIKFFENMENQSQQSNHLRDNSAPKNTDQAPQENFHNNGQALFPGQEKSENFIYLTSNPQVNFCIGYFYMIV